MATVKLHPILNSIHGRIGGVVFYQRKGSLCVRSFVIPRNPDTNAQRIVRGRFALAVKSWQEMTEDERYAYTRKARSLNMSGYNLFISEYLRKSLSSESKPEAVQISRAVIYSPVVQRRINTVSYSGKKALGEIIPFIPLQHGTG